MNLVYLSIGSNIENRIEHCIKALDNLSEILSLKAVSSFYETAPVGVELQSNFINCAAEVQTALEPQELLNSISKIEKILGRNTKGDYKPRTIDIDIIFYNDLVLENDKLIIPHKKAHLRKFVLEPICEIRPDLIHPVLNKTVSDILNELGADQYVRQIGKYY